MSDSVLANSTSVIYFSVAIYQNRVFTIDLYSYRTVFSLLKSIYYLLFLFLSPAIILHFSIVFHFSIFIYWPFSSSLFRSSRSYPSFLLSIHCPSIQTIQSWIIHKTPDLFQRLSPPARFIGWDIDDVTSLNLFIFLWLGRLLPDRPLF